MWHTVETAADIAFLMTQVGNFHDSVLKEIKYTSGAYVDEDGGTVPLNTKREGSIIFQRQAEHFSIIELRFEEIEELHLAPIVPDRSCEIFGAQILKGEKLFYWVDTEINLSSLEDIRRYDGTWIAGNRLMWRELER